MKYRGREIEDETDECVVNMFDPPPLPVRGKNLQRGYRLTEEQCHTAKVFPQRLSEDPSYVGKALVTCVSLEPNIVGLIFLFFRSRITSSSQYYKFSGLEFILLFHEPNY